MATAQEIRRRIRSVRNIAQITKALEAVSASRVRRAQAQVLATRPYAAKSWQVLTHLAAQPTQDAPAHPLLTRREDVNAVSEPIEHGAGQPLDPDPRAQNGLGRGGVD